MGRHVTYVEIPNMLRALRPINGRTLTAYWEDDHYKVYSYTQLIGYYCRCNKHTLNVQNRWTFITDKVISHTTARHISLLQGSVKK